MKAHLLSKKSAKRKRRFRSDQPLHKSNERAVKRLLGGVRK
jgi:ribosomal protein L35